MRPSQKVLRDVRSPVPGENFIEAGSKCSRNAKSRNLENVQNPFFFEGLCNAFFEGAARRRRGHATAMAAAAAAAAATAMAAMATAVTEKNFHLHPPK